MNGDRISEVVESLEAILGAQADFLPLEVTVTMRPLTGAALIHVGWLRSQSGSLASVALSSSDAQETAALLTSLSSWMVNVSSSGSAAQET